jgi:hypothetical protein
MRCFIRGFQIGDKITPIWAPQPGAKVLKKLKNNHYVSGERINKTRNNSAFVEEYIC